MKLIIILHKLRSKLNKYWMSKYPINFTAHNTDVQKIYHSSNSGWTGKNFYRISNIKQENNNIYTGKVQGRHDLILHSLNNTFNLYEYKGSLTLEYNETLEKYLNTFNMIYFKFSIYLSIPITETFTCDEINKNFIKYYHNNKLLMVSKNDETFVKHHLLDIGSDKRNKRELIEAKIYNNI